MAKIKNNFGNKAEKIFNDLTDSNLDFFEEEKQNLKNKKDNSKKEIIERSVKQENEIIDFSGDKIKKQILETLKEEYNKLYNQIEKIAPDKKIEDGENKGKTYLELLDKYYFSLKDKINIYSNDLELKKNYKYISNELWIFSDMLADTEKGELNIFEKLFGGKKDLEKLEEIKKTTVKKLELLQKTLVDNFGTKKDKENLEKKLQKLEDKINGNTPKDKFRKILEKNKVPEMITNIIISIGTFLGFFDENSFFSKTIDFFKHPINTIKNWWNKKDEEEKITQIYVKKEKKVIRKKIENLGNNRKKYKNGDFEIFIKNGEIEKILVKDKEYELNFNFAIDNIAINKVDLIEKDDNIFLELDIFGVEDKKQINLDSFIDRNIENKKNLKDKYILKKDLVLNFDLYLEKK